MNDRRLNQGPPTPREVVNEILCWTALCFFIWLLVRCGQ